MRILTSKEMRSVDKATAEKFGVPLLTLMENAGSAVARFVLHEFEHAGHICVVCGKGNNGGDGFVAARKLHEAGREVRVFLLATPEEYKGDAAAMLKQLPVKPFVVTSPSDLETLKLAESDLILDAIFGTGFRPPAEGLYAAAIRAINDSGVPVIAVDIPSGADADAEQPVPASPFVLADSIVTFSALKPAHVYQFSDVNTVVRDIGSPQGAYDGLSDVHLITPLDFHSILQPRSASANKGSYGHVLVVGGSMGKAGAPAMSGMAALRAGAGLVTVAAPRSIQSTVASFAPELMTEALEETIFGTVSGSALENISATILRQTHNVLALGPGLSRNKESVKFARSLVELCPFPIVLDADGLNAFEGSPDKLNGLKRTLVITPHPGEMARLTGMTVAEVQAERVLVAREFAREYSAYVVLKGHRTIIAEPNGRIWINPTGNPGMATGGTGDILTGIIAGLLAQELRNFAVAVIAAVWLHGAAGDIACGIMGERSLIATDLLSALPKAFMDAIELADSGEIKFQNEFGERA